MVISLRDQYRNHIRANNLKSSKRRDLIFEYIMNMSEHFTIDSLYSAMFRTSPDIGIATVYRTIRLLVDCGILLEHSFGEKKGYYEVNRVQSRSHGHLICRMCGKISEFQNDDIVEFQKAISAQQDFKTDFFRLEIYGICHDCRKQR
ncbi:MAG: Fur family transcriptional regulator [Candidatus Zhuqueibacterota bacterium]